ncbi:MAG: hypothetical protein ACRDND_09540, partial [Streptosporangiaceae bacterium]
MTVYGARVGVGAEDGDDPGGQRPAAVERVAAGAEGGACFSRPGQVPPGDGVDASDAVALRGPVAGPGSGYGDPLTREPGAVARDVREQKVTADAARVVYGVIIEDGVINPAARPAWP